MKVTNIQKGPRGINAVEGPVLVEPGQTVDVEVSNAELKVAKATGWFSIEGAKADPLDHDGDGKKGGSLPVRTAEEVLAMADDANVQFMSFKSAATKLLGDKTPAKKDEIVAALMELATKP